MSKLGLGALNFSSALAMYTSWGDPGSVAFVLGADAALLLLFLCLHTIEQARGGAVRGGDAKVVKAAVWVLNALLMAMFAYRSAPLVPLAVGAIFFLCLRDVDHQVRGGGQGGGGGGGVDMDGQYWALAKVGLAVLTCNSALDAYDTRRDPGSAALIFVSYILLVILTGLFVHALARGHAGEQGQGQH